MLHPPAKTHPPAAPESRASAREDEGTIAVFLTRREAFAVAWIMSRFLRQAPRPLTGLQERLSGLVLFLRDHLDPSFIEPIPADEGSDQHASIR